MHEKGARILYCDTDSLMLDMPFSETGKKLGDWELQGVITELELILPKVYRAVMSDGPETPEASRGKTVYKCKGCPIVRKWETPDLPQRRWEAFKNLRNETGEEAAEDARILGKDGVTGFVSDIKSGSLKPRRRQESCKPCGKTGVYNGIPCPACNGQGFTLKPLVRSLQSSDVKRIWQAGQSMPVHYPAAE